MIITFIRHGQTLGNKEGIVNGHFDDPLNVEGIQQAKELGIRMKGLEVDCIRASDLKRTYDTAQLITENAGWGQTIHTDSRLRERSHGKYEGQPTTLMNNDIALAGVRHYQFLEQSPDIEHNEHVVSRWQDWFEQLIEGKSYNHIVIVTHGSFIRSVAGHLLSMSIDEYWSLFTRVDNCCRVVIDVDKKRVLKFNA